MDVSKNFGTSNPDTTTVVCRKSIYGLTTTSDNFINRSKDVKSLNIYKNVLEERRKHQVIMLCTDLNDRYKSRHVIDSAIALRSYGHMISIITTTYSNSLHVEDLSQIKIIKTGAWIPHSFVGWFSDLFYFLRSAYTTLCMIYKFRKADPSVSIVICETNCLMIPLIKFLTSYTILYFQYKFDYARLYLPADKIRVSNWFHKLALLKSDEIIVPNSVFASIITKSIEQIFLKPTVCEPFINIWKLRNEKVVPLEEIFESLSETSSVFLALGEYHPRTNFELVIDAFYLVMHSIQHQSHRNMHLIISGHCSKRDVVQQSYYHQLLHRVQTLNLSAHVIFTRKLNKCHKKTLLTYGEALVDTTINGLFNRYILEAMALGRPVIAPDSGFAKEVLDNGVSGYLIPPTPEHFSVAMAEVLFNKGKAEFLGKMANCEFVKTFSLEAFAARLHNIINKHYPKEKRSNTTIITQDPQYLENCKGDVVDG